MGAIEATNVVVEYADFGGILVPVKAVQRAMGIESVVTITSVEYDVVDATVFELPPDVQALLAQPQDTRPVGAAVSRQHQPNQIAAQDTSSELRWGCSSRRKKDHPKRGAGLKPT